MPFCGWTYWMHMEAKRVQPHHHHWVWSKPWMMITFSISTWTCLIADFYLALFIDHCWCLPYYSIHSLLEWFSFVFVGAMHFAWFIMRMHSIPVRLGYKKLYTARETIGGKTGKYLAKFMVKTRALKSIEEPARTITAVNSSNSVAVLIYRFTQTH